MSYESFRIPEARIAALKKRAQLMAGVVGLTPLLTVFFLLVMRDDGVSSLLSLLVIGIGIAVIIVWLYLRQVNTWRQFVSRYEVRVGLGKYVTTTNPEGGSTSDATVLEDAAGMNWLTLNKDEIGSIVYFEGQRVIITGKNKSTVIPLNTKLSPFDDLLEALETLGPIERKTGNQFLAVKALVEYVPSVGLRTANFVDVPWLKLFAGVLAVLGYGYQLFLVYHIKIGVKKKGRAFFKVGLFIWALVLTWSGLQALLAG